MTPEEKLIKNKSGLGALSDYVKNASEVCHVMSYSRDTVYCVRKACKEGGIEALHEKNR